MSFRDCWARNVGSIRGEGRGKAEDADDLVAVLLEAVRGPIAEVDIRCERAKGTSGRPVPADIRKRIERKDPQRILVRNLRNLVIGNAGQRSGEWSPAQGQMESECG